jgi:uncharacterized protein
VETLFIAIYRFFVLRKPLYWFVFVSILLALIIGASQIRLEEDITKIFPEDDRAKELDFVFSNSKLADRIVVMISVKDSSRLVHADTLVQVTEEMISGVEEKLQHHVKAISAEVDDSQLAEVFSVVRENLPIFLTEDDYHVLDSLTQPAAVEKVLESHYRQLISPAGMMTKNIILHDPLGFSFLVLKKLERLQYDENFSLYNSYIVTKDKHHLLFFIQSAYEPNDTKNNIQLVDGLNNLVQEISVRHPNVLISFFGSSVVAAGNAKQIRQDTWLTVALTIVLLGIFLIGFFKKKRVPFLIFIPAIFGALFSLCIIFLVKGSVSVLAIAAGSVVLGIALNYSLHFLVHLKHTQNIQEVIKDLSKPMTLGSATTVLAFVGLQFTNASVLRDVGLFAAFSLIGAALCSLIFLPHMVSEKLFRLHTQQNVIERISSTTLKSGKYAVIIILVVTPVFFYFARQVSFNSDMGRLNFMKPDVREAQQRLESVNRASKSSVYIVSKSNDLQRALQKAELSVPLLDSLQESGVILKYSAVSNFLISDSLQQVRINLWNQFWKYGRSERLLTNVKEAGTKFKYAQVVFDNFEWLLNKNYQPTGLEVLGPFRKAFLDDYIIEKDNEAIVITLASVMEGKRETVYGHLGETGQRVFDRQMLTNIFIDHVNADFTFIVTFTSLLVFVALLLSYGRIELALISFMPMLITWIWILGLMALFGIEFNIVNVMISTFIFGLGDDYSIFIMDGLQRQYKERKQNLPSIRVSIFVSALTTICGLGVLIFAQHPALRSIAAIAIIGIVCVFIMAQTIEPFLFRWLITNRAAKGLSPMTFMGIARTIFTYGFFVSGSFVLTFIGLILKPIPFAKKQIRLLYHGMISLHTRTLVYLAVSLKKKIIGQTPNTFSKASIVISNHSSFLDILLTTMLTPRLILLTNKWVWNSPIFGGVVRLADYYPVMEGADESSARLKARVDEGYSVMVFPEGSRSPDGKLRRFHKGAFYLAESLQVPIQPLLIHGAHDGIRKNEIYLNESFITLKFLPPIQPDDKRFGVGYSARTKAISRYFKDEFNTLAKETETPEYYTYKLITNFLYKGPVLEWYLKIKLRLEKNYAVFQELVPQKARVLDLGCGYGFLCYMLQFLSEERIITGVDYDEEKITIAQHGYLRTERLNFVCSDIVTYPLEKYDVIMLNDVLHYLTPDKQHLVLANVFRALNPGGKVIIREGNTDLTVKHRGTKLSELFSVKLLRFNKANSPLHFISGELIRNFATQYNLEVAVMDNTRFTSNVIFVVSAPNSKVDLSSTADTIDNC